MSFCLLAFVLQQIKESSNKKPFPSSTSRYVGLWRKALVEHPICLSFSSLLFRHMFLFYTCWIWTFRENWRAVSEWVSTVLVEREREFVGEWAPARAFYTGLFLNAHPLLIAAFPLWATQEASFGPISCTHAARFAQNHRMIVLRLGKEKQRKWGWDSSEMKTEIGWHVQPSLLEFKGLACVQF